MGLFPAGNINRFVDIKVGIMIIFVFDFSQDKTEYALYNTILIYRQYL